MYEHLVTGVRSGLNFEGRTFIEYVSVETGQTCRFCPPLEQVGAIETWLAQPKPPTPEEQARDLVNAWYLGDDKRDLHIDSAKRGGLVRAIAQALENAAREARE